MKFHIKMLLALLGVGSFYESLADRNVISKEFFDASESSEKIYAVGRVTDIKYSDFEAVKCPADSACLHLPSWSVYEIEGYFVSNPNEEMVFKAAHYFGSDLYSDDPWFVTLEEIQDFSVREALDVKYKLVGVEVASSVFCPSGSDVELFKDWEAVYVEIKSGLKCYSF